MPNQKIITRSILNIFDRDTILHLRIPFSFYLLPVFCFAFSRAGYINWYNAGLIFLILHFFIYPGSNCYNSFMDKDTGSIGALENPPPATKKLYYASLIMDSIGLMLGLMLNTYLFFLLLLYVAISKAYSWNKIRLKKQPVISWIIVSMMQGGYTFLMIGFCLSDKFIFNDLTSQQLWGAAISSLLVAAVYPLTQVYQHMADKKRGDITISYLLGVRGTFIFSGIIFILGSCLFYVYFIRYLSQSKFLLIFCFFIPAVIFFISWFLKVLKNPGEADFRNTMRFNIISSTCMISGFIVLYLVK